MTLQAEQLMKRIGVEGVKLTDYEMNIASHLVDPQTMKVTVIALNPEIINHHYIFDIFKITLSDTMTQTDLFTALLYLSVGFLERYSRSG